MIPSVKFADGHDDIIEGLGLPFGGPLGGRDLKGSFFWEGTDFCLDLYPKGARPFMYDHGLNDGTKAAPQGRVVDYELTDMGIWTRTQLDRGSKYLEAMQELVESGRMGQSSGAMPHLIEMDRKTGRIDRWPWVELSGTPIPAHPSTFAAYSIKSADFQEHLEAAGVEDPAAMIALAESYKGSDPDTSTVAALGRLTFADNIDRVLGDVKSLVSRSEELASLRAETRGIKAGRILSTTNREKLGQVMAALLEVRGSIEELLASTEPTPKALDASDLLDEWLRSEAESLVAVS